MKSIKSGTIKLGELELKCHVLEDGQRVIEEQSVIDFFKWMESGNFTDEDANKFATELNNPDLWKNL